MPIYGFLQEIPRPFWIVGMILGFVWFWPVGLVALVYLLCTRRSRTCGAGRWYNTAEQGSGQGSGPGSAWGWGPGGKFAGWGAPQAQPTSNRAFDEYRADTLRRLEEEQKEFMDYLERLRQARDKQEFDQFMADRRGRSSAQEPGAVQAN